MPEEPDAVFGFEVHCTFRTDSGALFSRSFRSKGKSETKARRTPIFKRGFVSIDRLEPYTYEQWKRVFGEGRM